MAEGKRRARWKTRVCAVAAGDQDGSSRDRWALAKAATKGLQSVHETLEEAELKGQTVCDGAGCEPTARAPFPLKKFFLISKSGKQKRN